MALSEAYKYDTLPVLPLVIHKSYTVMVGMRGLCVHIPMLSNGVTVYP